MSNPKDQDGQFSDAFLNDLERLQTWVSNGGKNVEEFLVSQSREGVPQALGNLVRVQTFTAPLYEELGLGAPDVSFEEITRHPAVERVAANLYRVQERFATYLPSPTSGEKELHRTLANYYRSKNQGLSALAHLVHVDPSEAKAELSSRFNAAMSSFHLGLAQDLSRILETPGVGSELARLRADMQRRLKATSMWASSRRRTHWYQERDQDEECREAVLGDGQHWIVQLHAPGGIGKTMFLRFLIARVCLKENVPCALIDFDDNDSTVKATNDPIRLVVRLAEQLNEQLTGEPLSPILAEHEGLTAGIRWGGKGSDISRNEAQRLVERLGSALQSECEGRRIVVVLDTFENVLHQNLNPLGLLALLARIQEFCPTLRVVVAGRFRMDGERACPEEGQGPRHRVPEFASRFGAATRTIRLRAWSAEEARAYFSDKRGLATYPHLNLLVDKATQVRVTRGEKEEKKQKRLSPFQAALLADLIHDDPSLSSHRLEEFEPDLLYLIERILKRIEPKGVRWLLRFGGAVARRLSLDLVLNVLLPVQAQLNSTADSLDADHDLEIPKGTHDQGTARDLWSRLFEYASQSSWVSSEAVPVPIVVLHEEIRIPLGRVLREERRADWDALQERAINHWVERARVAGARVTEHAMAWGEALYHLFVWVPTDVLSTWRSWLAEIEELSPRALRDFAGEASRALGASREVLQRMAPEVLDTTEFLALESEVNLRTHLLCALDALDESAGDFDPRKARFHLKQAAGGFEGDLELQAAAALIRASCAWHLDGDLEAARDHLHGLQAASSDLRIRAELLRSDLAEALRVGGRRDAEIGGITRLREAVLEAEREQHPGERRLRIRLAVVEELRGNNHNALKQRRRLLKSASDAEGIWEHGTLAIRLSLGLGLFGQAWETINWLEGHLEDPIAHGTWRLLRAEFFLAALAPFHEVDRELHLVDRAFATSRRRKPAEFSSLSANWASLSARLLDHASAARHWADARQGADEECELRLSLEEVTFCLDETRELRRAEHLLKGSRHRIFGAEGFELILVQRRLARARGEAIPAWPPRLTAFQRVRAGVEDLAAGERVPELAKFVRRVRLTTARWIALRELRRCPTGCLAFARPQFEDLLGDECNDDVLRLVQVEALRCMGALESARALWQIAQEVEGGWTYERKVRLAGERLGLPQLPLSSVAINLFVRDGGIASHDSRLLRGVLHMEHARHALAQGGVAEAEQHLAFASDLEQDSVWRHHLVHVRAALLLAQGRGGEAREAAQRARRGFEGLGDSRRLPDEHEDGGSLALESTQPEPGRLRWLNEAWLLKLPRQEGLRVSEPKTHALAEESLNESFDSAMHNATEVFANNTLSSAMGEVLGMISTQTPISFAEESAWLPWELSGAPLIRATPDRQDAFATEGALLVARAYDQDSTSQELSSGQSLERVYLSAGVPALFEPVDLLPDLLSKITPRVVHLTGTLLLENYTDPTLMVETRSGDRAQWRAEDLAKRLHSGAHPPLVVLDVSTPATGVRELARQLFLRNRYAQQLTTLISGLAVLAIGPIAPWIYEGTMTALATALASGGTEADLLARLRAAEGEVPEDWWSPKSTALFTPNSTRPFRIVP